MEKIASLKGVKFGRIYEAFKAAFADYEIQLNKLELANMLKRRGFVPELSFAAFDKDRIVAFTLNGIGSFNQIKTAYDTGTGTLPEYRGQGLASKIFKYSLPYLISEGVRQYLLEVLQHNTAAVSIYKKLGFQVSRSFNFYSQSLSKLTLTKLNEQTFFIIENKQVTELESFVLFNDYELAWQNSFEAVKRSVGDFGALICIEDEIPVGYCIYEALSGDITQLAVKMGYRRKGIGRALLQKAIESITHTSVKLINIDENCEYMTTFLEGFAIPLQGQQFEMILDL